MILLSIHRCFGATAILWTKFVTVMPYLWNGHTREMLEDESEVEQRAEKTGNE